jgi:hypothetical protein
MSDPVYIVSMPWSTVVASGSLVVGARPEKCHRCPTQVAVSPSSQRKLAESADSVLLCMDCAHKQMDKDTDAGEQVVFRTLPGQREEIESRLGSGKHERN